MSQKFQASVQHRGDVSYVKLGGVIDEDNELGDLVDKIPSGTAVIDLGEVDDHGARRNPVGQVRELVVLVDDAAELDVGHVIPLVYRGVKLGIHVRPILAFLLTAVKTMTEHCINA